MLFSIVACARISNPNQRNNLIQSPSNRGRENRRSTNGEYQFPHGDLRLGSHACSNLSTPLTFDQLALLFYPQVVQDSGCPILGIIIYIQCLIIIYACMFTSVRLQWEKITIKKGVQFARLFYPLFWTKFHKCERTTLGILIYFL